MIVHGGSLQMFRWAIDDALDAGMTPDEVVGVMLAIAPLVGDARIAEAAPKVALALDYDLDEALEAPGP
jgi:alkylhydroperoxidase/carboxymuconolactone decarboxylase family protein YurZ